MYFVQVSTSRDVGLFGDVREHCNRAAGRISILVLPILNRHVRNIAFFEQRFFDQRFFEQRFNNIAFFEQRFFEQRFDNIAFDLSVPVPVQHVAVNIAVDISVNDDSASRQQSEWYDFPERG